MLGASGFSVRSYGSAEDFLAEAGERGCLVLDIDLPGMSGLDLQRELYSRGLDWRIVFLSAHADIISRSRTAAMEAGAVALLVKPARARELLDAVHRALEKLGIGACSRVDNQSPSV